MVMIQIKLLNKSSSEILLIIKEMANDGIVQGRDFDFAYHQAKYESDGWEQLSPKHTVFAFYTEQMATFFTLKYAH
jgi:hypothetical protein